MIINSFVLNSQHAEELALDILSRGVNISYIIISG